MAEEVDLSLIALLALDHIKLAPPSWLETLPQRNPDVRLWTEAELTDLVRALPLQSPQREGRDPGLDYFWAWKDYRNWCLPWRRPYGEDMAVFDATCLLRVAWIFLFGRLLRPEASAPTNTLMEMYESMLFTEAGFQDFLDLGCEQWQQDVRAQCQFISGPGWYRVFVTAEGLDLLLRVFPHSLREVLSLEGSGLEGMWQYTSVMLGSVAHWFLRRGSYKGGPYLYCLHAVRDQGALRSRMRRLGAGTQSPLMASQGFNLRVRRVLLPWLRNAPAISKWARQVLADKDCRREKFRKGAPRREEPQDAPEGVFRQGPPNPLESKPSEPAAIEHKDPNGAKQEEEIQAYIEELNRQARKERQERRVDAGRIQAFGERQAERKSRSVSRSPSPRFSRKELRAKQQSERRRHRAAAQQRESELQFLRECRPALEASKKGPADQTQLQEDPFPEIERQTCRALRAQARHMRQDQKQEKRSAQRLSGADVQKLLLCP